MRMNHFRFLVGHYAEYITIAGFHEFSHAESYIELVLKASDPEEVAAGSYYIDDLYGLRHRLSTKSRKFRLPRW